MSLEVGETYGISPVCASASDIRDDRRVDISGCTEAVSAFIAGRACGCPLTDKGSDFTDHGSHAVKDASYSRRASRFGSQ